MLLEAPKGVADQRGRRLVAGYQEHMRNSKENLISELLTAEIGGKRLSKADVVGTCLLLGNDGVEVGSHLSKALHF
jgi:hypothetical protein